MSKEKAMNLPEEAHNSKFGLHYQTNERQKCFVGHSHKASWSADIVSACEAVLPKFDLDPWYADDYPDPTKTLRDKVVEMIANARYGIYDLSYWRSDEKSAWVMPRNVLIELGMAIALNRPTLLLCHAENRAYGLILPRPLESMSEQILEFSGESTLKRVLEERLPQWVNRPPERDWWNRYCLFGSRICEYREVYPHGRQWGQEMLRCHISDGPDIDSPDFRSVLKEELGRYNDLAFDHLNELPLANGYDFLLCTHCQTVRSTPFAIYRITPKTPSETFLAIGMSIALEKQFGYEIPKILLTANVQDVPSLLSGYGVGEAQNDKQRRACLRKFIPVVVQKVRETSWNPRPLPFVEITPNFVEKPKYSDEVETADRLLEASEAVNLKIKETAEERLLSLLGYIPQSQEADYTVELVREALHHMSQQYRAALLLHTQEGFSYAEIAQALNIKEKSVKGYLARARRSFREHCQAVEQSQNAVKEKPTQPSDESSLNQETATHSPEEGIRHSQNADIEVQERAHCHQVVARLSPPELSVLRAFAKRLRPKDVATQLGITRKAVDNHKTNLLKLCRNVWNISPNQVLDYHFFSRKFTNYFESSTQATLESPITEDSQFESSDVHGTVENDIVLSSTGLMKVFLLGRPGSGKSTLARIMDQSLRNHGWSAIHISEYEILQEMFHYDVEHRQFIPTEHGGFEVIDFSVFDTALQMLEDNVRKLIHQSMRISWEEKRIILIELARNDYNEALEQFSRDFLEDAYFIFINADLETCIQRIHDRISHPITRDDYYVSEAMMRNYYYIQKLSNGEPSIDNKRFFVIDNTSSTLTAGAEQISRFVGSLDAIPIVV